MNITKVIVSTNINNCRHLFKEFQIVSLFCSLQSYLVVGLTFFSTKVVYCFMSLSQKTCYTNTKISAVYHEYYLGTLRNRFLTLA